MHITVTKADIQKGRKFADKQCGCPLWHAFARALGVTSLPITEDILKVGTYWKVNFGSRIFFKLPTAAYELQQILVAYPEAQPDPIEFDVELQVKL